jgi:MoaA/NifB/PqqE/SkfB family radical SAM enzyme
MHWVALYIKTFRFRRAWNALLTLTSYCLSVILRRTIVWNFPVGISIETTAVCNLHCPQCYTGSGRLQRENKRIPPETALAAIREASYFAFSVNLNFQGEPLLHPQLFDFISEVHHQKMISLLSTNAHFLDEENCRKLVQSGLSVITISMDGVTENSYQQYRKGGSLEQVKTGIRHLVQEKQKQHSARPYIILQFLVFRHNEQEIPLMREFAKQAGVQKLSIKSAQFYDFTEELQPPENAKYSRYSINTNQEMKVRKKLHNRCFRIWKYLLITTDGKMAACCFDKNAEYLNESFPDQSIKEIWKGESMGKLRKRILSERESIEMCTNCSV